MYSVGIDIGSVAAKAVLFDGCRIVEQEMMPTGWSPRDSGLAIFERLVEKAGINKNKITSIVGTGYGRVALPFVDKKVTEITCHGKGAYFLDNSIRTIIDIGGQDSKVISIDDDGNIIDFIMNDKCAAGTGRFLQVMAHALEMDVSKLSDAAKGVEAESINSMCTVFAESEVISLMANGATKESIAAGLLHSVCKRTCSLARKINIKDKVFFSGGVSQSGLLKSLLSDRLEIQITSSVQSQFLGAIGASVIGFRK